MKFKNSHIEGVKIIELPRFNDERGYFMKHFSSDFNDQLDPDFHIHQINISFNTLSGTFRGLHYQQSPFQEKKIINCLQGKALDIVLDLRKNSATFLQHLTFEIQAGDGKAILIPKGCAHGFITLEPETKLLYLHSGDYAENADAGINISDPLIRITLPRTIASISEKDKNRKYLHTDFNGI